MQGVIIGNLYKMRYDLLKSYDRQKVHEYLDKLIKQEAKVELKKIHPKRSTSANAYLHVLFTLWGQEFGYLMDEAKREVKTGLGYVYEKDRTYGSFKGVPERHYYKTSEMDSKQLTVFIDKFRDWSAQTCDLYLPSPAEFLSEQIYFENEIEKANQ